MGLRKWLMAGIVLVGTMACVRLGSQAQGPLGPTPGSANMPSPMIPIGASGGRGRRGGMSRTQLKMINEERQKQIISDTEKLVALANELKTSAGQAQESPEIAKKLDEIEKLAHHVKEKETE